jgi:hypothetical protein
VRKAATILLLTVFCNSLFYYGYLSCSLLKAKLDARVSLARIDPRASFDILRVPVSLLQKDESDEVWYNDKLYDVVERDRINDTLYVFLERDEQEQNVLARQQKYFQDSCGFLSAGGHEVTATKVALPVSDTECMRHDQRDLSLQSCVFKPSSLVNTSSLSADFSETASPPPKPA